jgi:hypothetical protein
MNDASPHEMLQTTNSEGLHLGFIPGVAHTQRDGAGKD